MKRLVIGWGVLSIVALLTLACGLASADDESDTDNDAPGVEVPGVQPPPSDGIATRPAPVQPSPDQPVTSPPQGAPPVAGGGSTPPTVAPLPPDRQRVLAPIDDAGIVILESFPPQYRLHVQAGLPSGCAQQAGYEVNRSGRTIRVQVFNSMPQGAVACTMIYGMYEISMPLGSDFDPGATYTVEVNGERLTFVAQ
jgi:hypothetical protein